MWDDLLVFSNSIPLLPLLATDIQLLHFPVAPAGGADSDMSFESALRDDLRPGAIFVSTGST